MTHLVPTPAQLRWQQLEFGVFIHFGIKTFAGKEWSDGTVPASDFNPTELDAGTWVRTTKEAGARYLIRPPSTTTDSVFGRRQPLTIQLRPRRGAPGKGTSSAKWRTPVRSRGSVWVSTCPHGIGTLIVMATPPPTTISTSSNSRNSARATVRSWSCGSTAQAGGS